MFHSSDKISEAPHLDSARCFPALVFEQLSCSCSRRSPSFCVVHRLRWGRSDHRGPGQLGQGTLQNQGMLNREGDVLTFLAAHGSLQHVQLCPIPSQLTPTAEKRVQKSREVIDRIVEEKTGIFFSLCYIFLFTDLKNAARIQLYDVCFLF